MQRNIRKRAIYGVSIGVLMHVDEGIWRAPGDVGNATSFGFPVHYQIVEPRYSEDGRRLAFEEQADDFVKAAQRLEYLGARAIVAACGFVAVVQREVADAVEVPVFSSSLILVPLAHASLAQGKKVGIITANSKTLTDKYTRPVGWAMDSIPVVVKGLEGSEFFRVKRSEHPSPETHNKLEAMMVEMVGDFLAQEPDIGAIVFECSQLPPYAACVREAFNLPVVDFSTMIDFAHQVVAGGRFKGYY